MAGAIAACGHSLPPNPPSAVVESVPSPSQTPGEMEQTIHHLINTHRRTQGLPPLQFHPAIRDQARRHSQKMALGQVPFSHDGFEQRVGALQSTLKFQAASENVAWNVGYPEPAPQAVQGWLESPGHLRNLEGPYNLTGVGVAVNEAGEYYFTQLFMQSP